VEKGFSATLLRLEYVKNNSYYLTKMPYNLVCDLLFKQLRTRPCHAKFSVEIMIQVRISVKECITISYMRKNRSMARDKYNAPTPTAWNMRDRGK
jgi:hypothetical protein